MAKDPDIPSSPTTGALVSAMPSAQKERPAFDLLLQRPTSLFRRIMAYCIDLLIVGGLTVSAIFVAATLAFIFPPLLFLYPLFAVLLTLLPFLYHSLQLAGDRQATIGQRLLGIVATDISGIGRVLLLQAFLHTLFFYASIALTGGLILLWPLFDDEKCCLHDRLSKVRFYKNT